MKHTTCRWADSQDSVVVSPTRVSLGFLVKFGSYILPHPEMKVTLGGFIPKPVNSIRSNNASYVFFVSLGKDPDFTNRAVCFAVSDSSSTGLSLLFETLDTPGTSTQKRKHLRTKIQPGEWKILWASQLAGEGTSGDSNGGTV